jgi:hypothetical protein
MKLRITEMKTAGATVTLRSPSRQSCVSEACRTSWMGRKGAIFCLLPALCSHVFALQGRLLHHCAYLTA